MAIHGMDSGSPGIQTISAAMMKRLIIARGIKPFHAKLMSWSMRNRGNVLLIQTMTKNTISIFIINQRNGGKNGPCQPPRKRVAIIAE